MEKIYLGKNLMGDKIYLYKHKWECGWYWGFGYLGNKTLHTHWNSELREAEYQQKNMFRESIFDFNSFFEMVELMEQAYLLQKMAEVYRHGNCYITQTKIGAFEKDPEKEKQLNNDLGELLDRIWNFVKGLKKQ